MITYDVAEAVFTTPQGRSVLFRYRLGTNDWNTLASCLNEDEYGLRTEHPRTAVDVGGYLGGVAIGIAVDNPEASVLVIEPVPDNVELIRWAIDTNKVADRVTVVQGAVGDGSEVETRYRYTGTEAAEHHAFVGNSSLAYDSAGFLAHEKITHRSLTIADVVDLVGEPDLVKIDAEGAEWAFLATGAALLPYIIGEWHPIRGHEQADLTALLPQHEVTFSGPTSGPGGFRAVRK